MAEDKKTESTQKDKQSPEKLFGGSKTGVSPEEGAEKRPEGTAEQSAEDNVVEADFDSDDAKTEKESPISETGADKQETEPAFEDDEQREEDAEAIESEQERERRQAKEAATEYEYEDEIYEAIKEMFIKEIKPDLVDNDKVFNRLSKKQRMEAKKRFGKEATKTAHAIRDMIRDDSLTYKKAFNKIDEWLRGVRDDDKDVSEFYLLQESKKITDEVRDIYEARETVSEDYPENQIAA